MNHPIWMDFDIFKFVHHPKDGIFHHWTLDKRLKSWDLSLEHWDLATKRLEVRWVNRWLDGYSSILHMYIYIICIYIYIYYTHMYIYIYNGALVKWLASDILGSRLEETMEMDTVAHLKEGHGFGEPLGRRWAGKFGGAAAREIPGGPGWWIWLVGELSESKMWLTFLSHPISQDLGHFDREKWRNKLELFIRKIGETRGLVQCI